MGYERAITFSEKCARQPRKRWEINSSPTKRQRKSEQKISSSKKYFSENYAYFPLFLTLGEREKGVVLMGD